MKNTLCLVLFVVACKSSDANTPANAAACATAAPELQAQLKAANGIGQDLTDPKSQPAIDAAKKAIMGKKLAFKNCAFASQGGDTVSFAATAEDHFGIECAMADGAAGTKQFRKSAMALDQDKLKLDVVGTVGEHDGRIKLTGCKITPHE